MLGLVPVWFLTVLIDGNPTLCNLMNPEHLNGIIRLAFGLDKGGPDKKDDSANGKMYALQFLKHLTCPSGMPLDNLQNLVLEALIAKVSDSDLWAAMVDTNALVSLNCTELLLSLVMPRKQQPIMQLTNQFTLRFKQLSSLAQVSSCAHAWVYSSLPFVIGRWECRGCYPPPTHLSFT